jgi:Zn-dependent peptidase ImmA (M78 family)
MDAKLEERCIHAARQLTDRFRQSAPPFPLQPLLNHFEVRQVRERPLDRDACLKLDSAGLFIEVNSLYSSPVRRMGIAHEIGHLIVDHCSQRGCLHWGHHDKWIEDLCDQLAGLLLAPSWAVRQYLRVDSKLSHHRDLILKPVLRKAATIFGLPVETVSLRIHQEMKVRYNSLN